MNPCLPAVRALVCGLLLVMLGGCLGGGTRAPARVLAAPASSVPAAATRLPQQLTVALPVGATMLDSSRVLVRPAAGELAYLTGVVWPDSAPRVLQDALVAALQQGAGFAAVGRQGFGLRGDALLHLQVQRLELDYSAAATQAVVELQAVLAAAPDGRALAQRSFLKQVPVAGRGAWAGGLALAQTLADSAAEIAEWSRQQLAAVSPPVSGEKSD